MHAHERYAPTTPLVGAGVVDRPVASRDGQSGKPGGECAVPAGKNTVCTTDACWETRLAARGQTRQPLLGAIRVSALPKRSVLRGRTRTVRNPPLVSLSLLYLSPTFPALCGVAVRGRTDPDRCGGPDRPSLDLWLRACLTPSAWAGGTRSGRPWGCIGHGCVHACMHPSIHRLQLFATHVAAV